MSGDEPSEKPLVHFHAKGGLSLPGATVAEIRTLLERLRVEYGLRDAQLVEAASYSMAMVVRAALGLSAKEGKVLVLAGDCLSGWIAIATLRHLATAGADGVLVIDADSVEEDGEIALQLKPIFAMGIPVIAISELLEGDVPAFLSAAHNLICGVTRLNGEPGAEVERFVSFMNEAATPIHSILAPIGVDFATGAPVGLPLYSSSTLSLGIPLKGLLPGDEFVGRHYVCDLSIPKEIYTQICGADLTSLFAQQPVIQIYSSPQ